MYKLDDHWTSGLYGAQAALLINPLEVVKTRLQLIGEEPNKFKRARCRSRSTLNALDIWRSEGLKVITKGCGPSMIQSAITNIASLQMLKHVEFIQQFKPRRNEVYLLQDSFRLASIIAIPAAILPSPLCLAKVRAMSNINGRNILKVGYQHHGTYTNTLGLLINAYQTEVGPYALYRAALSNHVKFTCLTSAALYSYVRIHWVLEEEKIGGEAYVPVISAILGASLGAFIAAPLDLISTRLYNQGISRYGGSMQYTNYKDCLLQILYKEGFLGLYKHSGAAMLTLTLHSAISIYLWDHYGQLFIK